MTGFRVLWLGSLLLACGAAQSFAQFKIELINQDGATAPCVGIGPVGGPLAKKCAELAEQAGFIRTNEAGSAGMTIGTTGKDDGVILAVQKESAAMHAGLEVGDVIIAVEDKPVKPTPGMIAEEAMFGRRGETVHLTVRRNGALHEVSLVRSPQTAPAGPKSHNMFVMVRPLINWRGQFVPCMGAGPLAPVALDMCDNRFKPYGYIKSGEFSSTGLQLDLVHDDSAIVSAVEPDSAAGKAGILPGDEIVEVDGHPLTASVGETFTEQIFGKIGAQFHVTVRRGQTDMTVLLQLAAKKKD